MRYRRNLRPPSPIREIVQQLTGDMFPASFEVQREGATAMTDSIRSQVVFFLALAAMLVSAAVWMLAPVPASGGF